MICRDNETHDHGTLYINVYCNTILDKWSFFQAKIIKKCEEDSMKVLEFEDIISFLEKVAQLADVEGLIMVNYKTTLTNLQDLRDRYQRIKT